MKPDCPIVFLDFDGVIRVAVEGGWVSADSAAFCQARMKMLGELCQAAGAKIVVSSDWRNMENLEEIKQHLDPYLTPYLHEDWATPIIGHRWNEVERWLQHHPRVERYAILEDFVQHFDGCSPQMRERLVICSNRYGLVPPLAGRILCLLTSPPTP